MDLYRRACEPHVDSQHAPLGSARGWMIQIRVESRATQKPTSQLPTILS
jgi:hypothetical protein